MERITESAIKRPPSPSRIAFQHAYIASPQQVDSNLLILLHGLGDTQASYVDLGKQLQRALPQCAVLALRGARSVPLLGGGMWWDAWDPLGEMLPASAQNPAAFIDDFKKLLDELTMRGWQSEHVHLLGFGQGATAALEGTHAWCRANKRLLGSVVAVCGGMLSFPNPPPLDVPVLHIHPPAAAHQRAQTTLQRAFQPLVVMPLSDDAQDRMPRGKEWEMVVRFWSEKGRWRNRAAWELKGEVYAVPGGQS
ncbi:Lysophospholipase [Ceraceosorus bombacis]|uniref:Lysophospholipase n=1 Tax=Ceraceosorus bombacis TaxID=401625 RepID=A0A0P1B8W2_9BASI|nr:Lysophospholipase [Ceraceosorus bombacis]